MKAVIQAGGIGKRLREITKDQFPKPLAKLNGKTILDWQFEQLKQYGITDIYLIIGYLGEKIEQYYGDGEKIGIKLSYFHEKQPLGSAGALYYLKEKIGSQDFLLLFGDIIFNIDLNRMVDFHIQKGSMATLFVHPNGHPYDSDLVLMDGNGRIEGLLQKNSVKDVWHHNCVNGGIYILSGKVLDAVTMPCKLDLEHGLLQKLLSEGKKLYGYHSTEYVKDAGTIERFMEIEKSLRESVPRKRNLKEKQRCIFLDRDGTINQLKGLLVNEIDLELIEGAAEAIRQINSSRYLAILVTNQPVIARGICSVQELEKIHKKLEVLLGSKGAYLDDIVYCPHHPDAGYPKENLAYKIKCDCRKPKIGMIRVMEKRYNIDLSASYIVGDTTVDMQTGVNAGMHTILLQTGEAGRDSKYDVKPEFLAENLMDAVQMILKK